MSITKTILNWTEEKLNDLDMNDKNAELKAVGLGIIDGLVDGAVLAYPILMVGCLYWRNKALKK